MADLGLCDSELNAKNLLRIKADLKQLVKERAEEPESIDDINAEIESEGPSGILERRLKGCIEMLHSLRARVDLAVSVVGVCIEDLTEFSQNPPSMLAIKDLLDSTEDFTDDTSRKTLRRALGAVQEGDLATCTDVLEDLEKAYKSLSEEHLARTTKILQTTQLAVRDLATNLFSRRLSRPVAAANKCASESTSDAVSVSSSSQDLQIDFQSKFFDLPNSDTEDVKGPNQVLDVASLHRYLDSVLMKVPGKQILEALQNLVNGSGSISESLNGSGHDQFKEFASEMKKEMKGLGSRFQTLEDRLSVKGVHEASYEDKAEDKKQDEVLQTLVSPESSKRSFPELEDEKPIKRSRAQY
jgi:hypothetical protein